MREKWKGLERFPRVLLVILAGMLVLFSILYPALAQQKGIDYQGGFLRRTVLGRAPDVRTLIALTQGPEALLTHRGEAICYWCATFFAAVDGISILFADALFRWNLRRTIRDPESAEPSDWALFWRKAGWVILAVMALVFYAAGLSM